MRGFDALSVPDVQQYAKLRALGFEVAAGYTRALTPIAIRTALGLGMAILPLTEHGNPTSLGYFTGEQGRIDGENAAAWADTIGMPTGLPIVGGFLDFDCPRDAMDPTILPFVNEYIKALGLRNPLWLYGPRDCIEHALIGDELGGPWPGIAGAMQAYAPAWSGGRNAIPSPYADVVQVRNGVTVAGIELDLQSVQTAARLWRLA